MRLAALALQPGDLRLHASELLLHGLDQALELLCAHRHLAARALLLGTPLLGQALGERVAGLREHVGGDRLQFVAHAASIGAQQDRRAGGAEGESEDQQQDAHAATKGDIRLGREALGGRCEAMSTGATKPETGRSEVSTAVTAVSGR